MRLCAHFCQSCNFQTKGAKKMIEFWMDFHHLWKLIKVFFTMIIFIRTLKLKPIFLQNHLSWVGWPDLTWCFYIYVLGTMAQGPTNLLMNTHLYHNFKKMMKSLVEWRKEFFKKNHWHNLWFFTSPNYILVFKWLFDNH